MNRFRHTLVFLFMLAPFVTSAQVRLKLNYNKDWKLTTSDSAAFIRICIYDTTNSYFAGPVADLYLNGKPQMKGTYLARKKEGEFTFYYENGNVQSIGEFENDVRVGTWKYFYENGNEKLVLVFSDPDQEPKVVFLKDEDGDLLIKSGFGRWREEVTIEDQKVVITGEYKNSKRDGTWRFYNPTIGRSRVEIFEDGKFVRGYLEYSNRSQMSLANFNPEPQFQLPTKFAVTESFVAQPGVDFSVYPHLNMILLRGFPMYRQERGYKIYTSSDTTKGFTLIDIPATPQHPRGLDEFFFYVKRSVKYPEEAKRDGVEGIVLLEYLIIEDGGFSNFKVLKGIGSGCDQEAIRIMQEYTKGFKWNPAMKDGKPIPQRMVLPVTFSFGEDVLHDGSRRDRIYTIVDTHAAPIGGYDKFRKYISRHLEFPQEAIKNRLHTTVTVEFVVLEDGTLRGFKVATPKGFGFDEEALRVMRAYGREFKWTPASFRSKNVSEKRTAFIEF